jgi:hypothetical protein
MLAGEIGDACVKLSEQPGRGCDMGGIRHRVAAGRAAVAAVAIVGTFGSGLSSSAYAGPEPGAEAGACKSKSYVLLFWPQGHGAIPAYGFPEFPVPHVEVYTDPDLAEDSFAAFLGDDGSIDFADRCTTKKAVSLKKPKSVETGREAATVTCKFKKSARVQAEPGDGTNAPRVGVFESAKRVGATATLGPTGAEVVYDRNRCEVGPPPA